MTNITITFRDGAKKDFKHEGRAGGSYSKSGQYVEGWFVVTDEYSRQTAYPADTIEKVEIDPELRARW